MSKIGARSFFWICNTVGERALMMSDFIGGGSKMTPPKKRTLEGKNWALGRRGGQKNRRASFMYVP